MPLTEYTSHTARYTALVARRVPHKTRPCKSRRATFLHRTPNVTDDLANLCVPTIFLLKINCRIGSTTVNHCLLNKFLQKILSN